MAISLANVDEALREEDIEGFITLGAPGDEYSHEAQEITAALASLRVDQLTEANIVAILALVWAKAFNRSPQEIKQRIPAFQHVANRLLS